MAKRVAIIGTGCAHVGTISPAVSYKEMMYDAAARAYADAGVDPRTDVNAFITASEDFWEGTSIFDEYVPDQLGGALRPVHTISGDGIQALATAVMMIRAKVADVIAVEAHSKASNMLSFNHVLAFALDPALNRPLGFHPLTIAGLEMNRFLFDTGNSCEHCALVAAKNYQNALRNGIGVHGATFTADDVLTSPHLFAPLRELEIARPSDGAFVVVVASEDKVREFSGRPVWIDGISFCSGETSLETRSWSELDYVARAAQLAYDQAGIKNPAQEIDIAEIDDSFAYKELQHMEALGLARPGEAGMITAEGRTLRDGELPVNASGGCLGVGHLLDANGLHKIHELVNQLRGTAGTHQVPGVSVGLAQAWRNIPTTTAAVAILSGDEEGL